LCVRSSTLPFESLKYKPISKTEEEKIFLLPPLEVLASGAVHARPSTRSLMDMSGNISAACVWGTKKYENISDQNVKIFLIKI
jgi:hypothetical protein